MAEEFALGKLLVDCTAMHGNKRKSPSLLVQTVDRTGDDLFPGAGFSDHQNRRIAGLRSFVSALQNGHHSMGLGHKSESGEDISQLIEL